MMLRVLAGAKQGTKIPLKKSKFVIGRASDCTLRAGSEAISRHHCVVLRRDTGVSIRDLGSRNGTFVNDAAIDGETALSSGDRVRVGPLEFVYEATADLARDKQPKVNDIAEAVERAAERSGSATIEEDDISAWLLGPDMGEQSTKETRAFSVDETRALPQGLGKESEATEEASDSADEETDGQATIDQAPAEESEEEDSKNGKGKRGKKKFGKLPALPQKPQTKDSREAAADILRELARRR